MYQDEIILGYRHTFADGWSAVVNYINRTLGRSIDDISVPNDATDDIDYVLTNPGTAVTYWREINDDQRPGAGYCAQFSARLS